MDGTSILSLEGPPILEPVKRPLEQAVRSIGEGYDQPQKRLDSCHSRTSFEAVHCQRYYLFRHNGISQVSLALVLDL